jgi:3-methyladenine DNA glycosylase AlkC
LKTLELSNALLEKSKLESECNFLKSKLLEKEILLNIINDFIDFNKINQLRVFDKKYFTIDKVSNILNNIRNDKDKKIKYIQDLQAKIIPFSNSIIGQHYNDEFQKNIINIENNYNKNIEIIYRFESENKFYERIMFILMSLIAIFGFVGLRDLMINLLY